MIDFTDITSGNIPTRLQILAIFGSLFLLISIIQLVRRERLKEGYSIIWLVVASFMVAFSLHAGLLQWFSSLVGISYAPAALFLIALTGLVLLSLHFSLLICRFDKRIRRLAQEHAIMKQELLREIANLKQHEK